MSNVVEENTGLGNYFVANYPPFSAWKPAHLRDAQAALQAPPRPDTKLGLYLHIPFCRKRCKFCYFRVYTDKNARDVENYIDTLLARSGTLSAAARRRRPAVAFRLLRRRHPVVSQCGPAQALFQRLRAIFPWDQAEEVTFECEPGTLQQHKLAALKELGVTRLSLGIENFSDADPGSPTAGPICRPRFTVPTAGPAT